MHRAAPQGAPSPVRRSASPTPLPPRITPLAYDGRYMSCLVLS